MSTLLLGLVNKFLFELGYSQLYSFNLFLFYVNSTSFIGEGNGNPLQYSCLENPTDGGAWWAAVHGVAEGQTRLSDFSFTYICNSIRRITDKEGALQSI